MNPINRKTWKIIFLDLDGVINGNTSIFLGLCLKLGLYDRVQKLLKLEDMYTVHEKKVKRLAKICEKTGAKIVLSSSWRKYVWRTYIGESRDTTSKAIVNLFNKYNIKIIGTTPELTSLNRQSEINKWLSLHEDRVDNFIIMDDEYEEFTMYYDPDNRMGSKLVLTSDATPSRKIAGFWYCKDGIRNKHVREAIKKLNNKNL